MSHTRHLCQLRRRGRAPGRPALPVAARPRDGAALSAAFVTAVLWLLVAGLARGAVGIGTSPPATIDTVPPVVALDPLPDNLLLLAGQSVSFHWTTADDHPGATAADFTAEVRDAETPIAAIDYLATFAETTWSFQAPELSSGYLRVVVTCRDAMGNTTVARSTDFSVILSTSAVPGAGLPARPVLEGNQPNPCNPGTTVRFSLPAAQPAALELYAADGSRVRRLAEGDFAAGRHEVFWDGRDDHGRAVASGTYLLRLTSAGTQQTRKLALIR